MWLVCPLPTKRGTQSCRRVLDSRDLSRWRRPCCCNVPCRRLARDGADQTAGCSNARWLQCGLDGLEQLEAHRAVIAPQRDHETHFPIRRGIGVTRQRADAVEGARLVRATIMAAKEIGVRREKVEYLGETARREAVAAADARTFFEMDGFGKAVRSQELVRDL